MSRRLALVMSLWLVSAAVPIVAALQTDVGLEAIDDALALIRSGSAEEHARFNAPYRLTIGKEPLDYLEVMTPFRRIVLAGAARMAAGDRGFGQRQAIELLATDGARLDVYAELTFHPLNTYIGVPSYRLTLEAASGRRLEPVETIRLSRWTARRDGPSPVPPFNAPSTPGGAPLLGATIIGRFDLKDVMPTGTYVVVLDLAGKEEGRGTVALATMR
jgi:hypothetical protein